MRIYDRLVKEDLIKEMENLGAGYQAIGRLARLMENNGLSVGALAELPSKELMRPYYVGKRVLEKADKAIASLLRIL